MIGQDILHYRVLEQMGAGGMGVVYRALDTRLGRNVALKFLPEPSRLDPTSRGRLLAEAQAAARLDHPNIGVIHSIEDVENQPFIVMALYEGESLRRRIDRAPMSIDEASAVALQAAHGLSRAHASGIIHRDIKPDNLFLSAQGMVKILDFGLAKLDEMDGLTSAGSVVGTLEYMSPEQIRGQAVDQRTDIWALGVVLYEMLTRISPFRTEGGMTASILRIIKDEPEPLLALRPDAPPRLASVVERALAKDRDQRYRAADEFVADLEAARSRSTTSAAVPGSSFGTAATPVAGPSPAPAAQPSQPAAPQPAAAATAPAAPIAPVRPPVVLPTPTTPLVGRQNELSIIAANLADPHCRVLTLFGPGGTGKTRLVIDAARHEAERDAFSGGVYFVPLDALSDPDLIPSSIARVLGVQVQPQEPALAQVQRHIGDQSMLMVLDNYEHVMDGAHLPSELVQACPGLRILVTSRERLNLEEEWVLPIPGLTVPHIESLSHEEAQQFDSVQLFVHRAKRSTGRFSLEDEDPAHVCRICRLVGGSPLGIELAAVWVKMMPCEEIAREIQSSIDFLESTSRNVSERHRSIRACFEYSWTLLTKMEQDALRRLAVFAGGFTRQAAAEVAGVKLPVLGSLVDKSLLIVEGGRYDSHPLLHGYAREKLAELPELQAEAETKHGEYYARFLEGCVGEKNEIEQIEGELGNILGATQTAVRRGDDQLLVRLMRLLAVDGAYYVARGHTPHSLELLKSAAGAAKSLGDLAAAHYLLAKLGNAYRFYLGRLDMANDAYREALSLAEQLQDYHRQVIVLSVIGHTRSEQGAADADSFLERALALATEHNDALGQDHVLQNQGLLAYSRGDWSKMRTLFTQSLEIVQALKADLDGNRVDLEDHLFSTLLNLGEAERMLGNFEEALKHRKHALTIAEENRNEIWKAYALHEIGETYHVMEERELAQHHLAQALTIWRFNNVAPRAEALSEFMKAEGYKFEMASDNRGL